MEDNTTSGPFSSVDDLSNRPIRDSTMCRYSLRSLLICTAIVGAFLFAARDGDWVAGVGLMIAIGLFASVPILTRRKVDMFLRVGVLSVAIGVAWFTSIDEIYGIRSCPNCRTHSYFLHVRIQGIAVYRRNSRPHTSLRSMIARDLGRPCLHEFATTRQIVRVHGLLIPHRLTPNGICCLAGLDDSYNKNLHPLVIKAATKQPELADEFGNWLRDGSEKDDNRLEHFVDLIERGAGPHSEVVE